MISLMQEEYFKNNSLVDLNVESKLVNIAIKVAQERVIKHNLSSGLYNKLLSFTATDVKLPANINYYNLLQSYVTPAMLWWASYYVIMLNDSKIKNKNTVVQDNENSVAISNIDSKYDNKLSEYKSIAEGYSDELIKYILSNLSIYPEYNSVDSIDDVMGDENGFDFPIYIPSEFRTGRYCSDLERIKKYKRL